MVQQVKVRPDIQIIAPWREWDLNSREKLMAYAAEHNISVEKKKDGSWSVSPEEAPDQAQYVELDFVKGDIVAIDGEKMSPATVMEWLNKVGGEHGIGRDDIVENRYVGMKSRGCYETPAGTIMLRAHRAMESLTLDREVAHLKDELMPRYAEMIYNGYWWSPEREMMQKMIDESQEHVNGTVRVKLYGFIKLNALRLRIGAKRNK